MKTIVASGLYVNEETGETFEIYRYSANFLGVKYPDFFAKDTEVHADYTDEEMLDFIFTNKVSYIGEV